MRVLGVRLNHPFFITCAGRLAGALLRTLFATVRMEIHASSVNPYDSDGDERFLFSIWHDAAVMASFGGRHKRTIALTSRHRDGKFTASTLECISVKSVRGSSGKSGTRAALELLKHAKTKDIVVTPDGPRGPRRKLSRGIVYIASKTGNAIVPSGFACSDPWDIRGSWTSLTIPKPFSRIIAIAGDPIYVPPNLSDQDLTHYLQLTQDAMDKVQNLAAAQLAHPVPNPLDSLAKASLPKVA